MSCSLDVQLAKDHCKQYNMLNVYSAIHYHSAEWPILISTIASDNVAVSATNDRAGQACSRGSIFRVAIILEAASAKTRTDPSQACLHALTRLREFILNLPYSSRLRQLGSSSPVN